MKTFLSLVLVLMNALNQMHAQQTNKSVLPSELANQEGNATFAAFSGIVPEFQQLFRASTLANEWSSPVKITGVSFRANGTAGAFDALVPRVEIRLSTSVKVPETMVASYNSNRGGDETLVFARDNVSLFSADGPSPRAFDLTFQFDQPFTYDPKNGALLMHFRHSGIAAPRAPSIDSEGYSSLSSSPVAFYADSGFVAPAAYGAAMEFQWVSIPEPTTACLFYATGFVLLLCIGRGAKCRC